MERFEGFDDTDVLRWELAAAIDASDPARVTELLADGADLLAPSRGPQSRESAVLRAARHADSDAGLGVLRLLLHTARSLAAREAVEDALAVTHGRQPLAECASEPAALAVLAERAIAWDGEAVAIAGRAIGARGWVAAAREMCAAHQAGRAPIGPLLAAAAANARAELARVLVAELGADIDGDVMREAAASRNAEILAIVAPSIAAFAARDGGASARDALRSALQCGPPEWSSEVARAVLPALSRVADSDLEALVADCCAAGAWDAADHVLSRLYPVGYSSKKWLPIPLVAFGGAPGAEEWALKLCRRFQKSRAKRGLLAAAASAGCAKLIERLLHSHAPEDAEEPGPLVAAAEAGHALVVDLLVEMTHAEGRQAALQRAAALAKDASVLALVKGGADADAALKDQKILDELLPEIASDGAGPEMRSARSRTIAALFSNRREIDYSGTSALCLALRRGQLASSAALVREGDGLDWDGSADDLSSALGKASAAHEPEALDLLRALSEHKVLSAPLATVALRGALRSGSAAAAELLLAAGAEANRPQLLCEAAMSCSVANLRSLLAHGAAAMVEPVLCAVAGADARGEDAAVETVRTLTDADKTLALGSDADINMAGARVLKAGILLHSVDSVTVDWLYAKLAGRPRLFSALAGTVGLDMAHPDALDLSVAAEDALHAREALRATKLSPVPALMRAMRSPNAAFAVAVVKTMAELSVPATPEMLLEAVASPSDAAGPVVAELLATFPQLRGERDHKLLVTACEHGSRSALEALLAGGVSAKVEMRIGRTPLMVCAASGALDKARLLLKGGADPNAANADGETPLLLAVEREDCEELALELVAAGAAVDVYPKPRVKTLVRACAHSHWRLALKLAEARCDATDTDNEGRTALHHACANNAPPEVIEAILKLPGVAVNAKNCHAHTALYHATSAKAVALLLEAGADARASPILCEFEKQYALLCLAGLPDRFDLPRKLKSEEALPMLPLLYCTVPHSDRAAHRVLRWARHDEQRRRESCWRLMPHVAAAVGNVEMLRELLRLSEPDACDMLGNTPLHYSMMWGRDECSLLLLSRIVQPVPVALRTDWRGRSAVDHALESHSPRALAALVYEGLPSRIIAGRGFKDARSRDALCQVLLDRITADFECTGTKYTDAEFPPSHKSLYILPDRPSATLAAPSAWVRVTEQSKPQFLFSSDGPSPGDIDRGAIGDCCLMNALAVVSAHDRGALLKDTVFYKTTEAMHRAGVRALRLYSASGRHIFVIVDDFVPFGLTRRRGDAAESVQPVYAHTRSREQWYVAFVEKAYAKLRGSYESIDGGGGGDGDALRCLVGGALSQVDLTTPEMLRERQKGTLWHRLASLHADPSKFNFLTCKIADADMKSLEGLAADRAYGVLGFVTLSKAHHLVLMYNAYGDDDWQGEWSNASSRWTPGNKGSLPAGIHPFDRPDGTFFLEFETDFLGYFDTIDCCAVQKPSAPQGWRLVPAYSEVLPIQPAVMLAVRMSRSATVHVDIAQQAARDQQQQQSSAAADQPRDELGLVVGLLPLELFHTGADSRTIVVAEQSAMDVVARHLDVLSKARPTTERTSSAAVRVYREQLDACGRTLFVAALWRPMPGQRRTATSLHVCISSEEPVQAAAAGGRDDKDRKSSSIDRVQPVELAPASLPDEQAAAGRPPTASRKKNLQAECMRLAEENAAKAETALELMARENESLKKGVKSTPLRPMTTAGTAMPQKAEHAAVKLNPVRSARPTSAPVPPILPALEVRGLAMQSQSTNALEPDRDALTSPMRKHTPVKL
eukprot:m51a1_g10049 putative calpain-type cysteine protease family isoform 5 (1791) ;mRNA; f:41625-47439